MSAKTSNYLSYDWPHDISYDKSDPSVEKFYSTVRGTISDASSIFYKKRQVDIFLLAMAIGKSLGHREPLKKPSDAIRRDALSERAVWMMCSVALSDTKNLDVLADPAKAVRICEEYANAGIGTLMALSKRPGDTTLPYEEFLKELFEKNRMNRSFMYE